MNLRRKVCGIPLPAAVAIALIFAYAFIFGKQTMWVWQVRQETADDPRVAVVPIPLLDASVSTTPGHTIIFFGYQFEVPWQGHGEVKNSWDIIAVAHSPSGDLTIALVNPANRQNALKDVRQKLKERGVDSSRFDPFLGYRSEYDLERATLFATPSQLSLFSPYRKEVSAANLLLEKQGMIRSAGRSLYSFQFGRLRGFQIGDPTRVGRVTVDAFDDQNGKFEFTFECKPAPAPALNQSDINRVLQTLQPAPAGP